MYFRLPCSCQNRCVTDCSHQASPAAPGSGRRREPRLSPAPPVAARAARRGARASRRGSRPLMTGGGLLRRPASLGGPAAGARVLGEGVVVRLLLGGWCECCQAAVCKTGGARTWLPISLRQRPRRLHPPANMTPWREASARACDRAASAGPVSAAAAATRRCTWGCTPPGAAGAAATRRLAATRRVAAAAARPRGT